MDVCGNGESHEDGHWETRADTADGGDETGIAGTTSGAGVGSLEEEGSWSVQSVTQGELGRDGLGGMRVSRDGRGWGRER